MMIIESSPVLKYVTSQMREIYRWDKYKAAWSPYDQSTLLLRALCILLWQM
jgi:hypothetical protein